MQSSTATAAIIHLRSCRIEEGIAVASEGYRRVPCEAVGFRPESRRKFPHLKESFSSCFQVVDVQVPNRLAAAAFLICFCDLSRTCQTVRMTNIVNRGDLQGLLNSAC